MIACKHKKLHTPAPAPPQQQQQKKKEKKVGIISMILPKALLKIQPMYVCKVHGMHVNTTPSYFCILLY